MKKGVISKCPGNIGRQFSMYSASIMKLKTAYTFVDSSWRGVRLSGIPLHIETIVTTKLINKTEESIVTFYERSKQGFESVEIQLQLF